MGLFKMACQGSVGERGWGWGGVGGSYISQKAANIKVTEAKVEALPDENCICKMEINQEASL